MDYKCTNSFEGELSRVKTKFEFVKDGIVKVLVSYWEEPCKMIHTDGHKILKYSN